MIDQISKPFNYKNIGYNLLSSYNISINKEYSFVYDNFLLHIYEDTETLFKKNYRIGKDNKYSNENKYKETVFRSCLYKHLVNSDWFNKLHYPEKYPEFKRVIRLEKLKKIFE